MLITSFPYHKLKSILISLLMAGVLTGCMEAGAADWIGAKPAEAEPVESEPSTEAPTIEAVGEVSGGDKEVENELPTYSIEEDDEEDEYEEDEDEEEDDEEEEEEVSDNSVSADEAIEDDDDNHDVTKGSWDGDDWTAEATIGEDYSISVTVMASKSSMQQEKVTDYSAAEKQKGNDIDDVRFSYYTKYEDGDKEAAADDVEDFEDIDKMSSKQMNALMAVADDIGKLIRQFGITAYDFSKPAENDDNEIILDLYRKSTYQYLMTLTFDEDDEDKLISIDFELQE